MSHADLPLSREDLCRQVNTGKRFKYLYFWGHRPPKGGGVSSSCFSQWYAAPFVLEGVRYPTAEHYMMASKARLFNDAVALDRVLDAASPAAAKAAGREVLGFNEEAWVKHRFDIVCDANFAKFSQSTMLREFLLSTGLRVLVEASPVDHIWGIGLSATDSGADNPNLWNGLNLLGFALMSVRARLTPEN
ncbi:MAG TPA: NADAR family protein [Casimicrobium sp.]|nr:NADAR family protein [Casimicrobium sp.]